MELYWIYFGFAISCVYVDQSSGQYGIPCPHMFKYEWEGSEWVGLVQVQSLPLGKTMNFEIILSTRAKLLNHQQYFGAVELYGSREDAIQKIRLNRLVQYRIRFPSQRPLPKLVQISVNAEVLCTGQPEIGAYVTLIKLEHTLYTEVAAAHLSHGVGNNIYPENEDPFVIYNNDDIYDNQLPAAPERPHIKSLPPPRPNISTYKQTTDPIQMNKCGTLHVKNNFKSLVVGGESVKRGAWPWLAAVYIKDTRSGNLSFNCGGNLVSTRTVITAAHCLRTSKRTFGFNEVVVFLGRFNIRDQSEVGGKEVQVEQIIVHSDYMSQDSSYDADIAVIILLESVKFTEFIRPICLWYGSNSLSSIEGQLGTVVGWGRDGMGNVLTPEPKKINIPVVSDAECLRSSDTYRYITSQRTFCAGGRDGRGPCNGDSGGGMAFMRNKKWVLRGIVSASLADPIINTCNLGEYVVFTDVAKHVSWIKTHMR